MVGLRAAQVANILLTLGERGHMIAEAARRAGMKKSSVVEFNEFDSLLEWLKANLTQNDTVLIKGSHGLRMDRITSLLEGRS
jgi:UDP-N-acetylmuramoyl-tripeptide--D-alanyl-D-alanine ligase